MVVSTGSAVAHDIRIGNLHHPQVSFHSGIRSVSRFKWNF